MKLIQEFTFNATLAAPMPVGSVPIGTRMVYPVTGGTVTGERLSGKVVGGGEWALIGPDGFLRPDVEWKSRPMTARSCTFNTLDCSK